MKEDTVEASSGQRYLDSANNNRSTMNKGLQIVFLCLAAASAVYARPGVFGYPYGAVPHVGALPVPVHDTPEVAAAKAAHFAAYNAAASGTAVGVYAGPYVGHEDDGQYRPGYEGQYLEHDDGLYRGHYVDGLYRGHYEDDGQYHGEGLYASQYGHYAGPIAGVPVIVNGVPADTPEVAAAKAAHFAAHAHAGHHYG